jgi:phospholipase/carboxylesterase
MTQLALTNSIPGFNTLSRHKRFMAECCLLTRLIIMQNLETLEISGNNNITSSVIWMHGLGADGGDFSQLVRELQMPNTRFILPHAPLRPVTCNGGYVMRAWYDIYGLEISSMQDEIGIRAAQRQIEALIEQEQQRGVVADRIVLAGFSQGGAIALHTALRFPQRLAGVLALSTYLPLKLSLSAEAHTANHNLPIFMAHGSFDAVIGLNVAQASALQLQQAGYPVAWHEYAMAHSVCEQEVADLRIFLLNVLTPDTLR